MSISGERKCNFSPVSTEVYTALIHYFTCRLEARQALIYQLVLGLTGKSGKYNYSGAVHIYPPFFDIPCSAKNYKIAPALTIGGDAHVPDGAGIGGAGAGIQRVATHTGDSDDIPVTLEAGIHCPQHIVGIEDIHVLVHQNCQRQPENVDFRRNEM